MKLIISLVCIVFMLLSGSTGNANIAPEPVILLVNGNAKVNYVVGEYCGNATVPCTNLKDAVAYFNTISTFADPTLVNSTYQQLTLQLTDGNYSIEANQITNAFRFNLTVAPVVQYSKKVWFNSVTVSVHKPNLVVINGTGLTYMDKYTYVQLVDLNFTNVQSALYAVNEGKMTYDLLRCSFLSQDSSNTTTSGTTSKEESSGSFANTLTSSYSAILLLSFVLYFIM